MCVDVRVDQLTGARQQATNAMNYFLTVILDSVPINMNINIQDCKLSKVENCKYLGILSLILI